MYRSGLVDTLVTHANMKGLGLTPLFGDRRGFMPPQLKTNSSEALNDECQSLQQNKEDAIMTSPNQKTDRESNLASNDLLKPPVGVKGQLLQNILLRSSQLSSYWRNNMNAINDGFGKTCATCEMWNRCPTTSSCNPGLLIRCLLNDRVRRIGSVCFRVIVFICRSCFA